MNRRRFLEWLPVAATLPPVLSACARLTPGADANDRPTSGRVRPGHPSWPADTSWERLRRDVGGRLIRLESPLAVCRTGADPAGCDDIFARLTNPFYIGDHPALTQTSGYADAWTSTPSAYAVAAASTADVVVAVNYAREHNLRLVIKGGGHSYQGTSNSVDSLLIWTRAMNDIALHDGFVASGCAGASEPQAAVSIGSGALWGQVYATVTTRAGRYVQGGGCTTVGVAGLIQSGGFGSFSKRYGLAAASLLEAEVVTADGLVRVANACTNPELFWALKGGGGGSFGVMTRLTLKTHALPEYFGGVFGMIKANSDSAFRRLVERILAFYGERLFDPHWGEQIRFSPDNTVGLSMVFQGLTEREAREVWRSFLEWVAAAPEDFDIPTPIAILAIRARHFWNTRVLRQQAADLIIADARTGAPEDNFIWAGDQSQAGNFLHAYRSTWLTASLLEESRRAALADAVFDASRHWSVSLHFNKGLAGAPAVALDTASDTAMNPAVVDAFALAIIGSDRPAALPGIPGHEPDLPAARRDARAVNRAMEALLRVVDEPASYLAESDFFERAWQRSFWGSHYQRLAAVKRRYDPDGLFFVHHGVGSEEWSDDGFTRVSA